MKEFFKIPQVTMWFFHFPYSNRLERKPPAPSLIARFAIAAHLQGASPLRRQLQFLPRKGTKEEKHFMQLSLPEPGELK